MYGEKNNRNVKKQKSIPGITYQIKGGNSCSKQNGYGSLIRTTSDS